MARIRTIKPEFWDSPSTASAGPWARLAFIGMWNWADDFGRGTLNYKELEGFIFPNDSTFTDRSGNTVNFRAVVAEVSECFGVVLYEVDGRCFYAIPSWDKHQRNERRAQSSKHPEPTSDTLLTMDDAEMHGISATPERKMQAVSGKCSLGTGEQGNRLHHRLPSMASMSGGVTTPRRSTRGQHGKRSRPLPRRPTWPTSSLPLMPTRRQPTRSSPRTRPPG